MSTDQHPTDTTVPTAAVALPTLRTRTRVLAGLGIAAALGVAAVTCAGIAAGDDEPTPGPQIVEDHAADPGQEFNEHTGLVWDEEARAWMFADTAADTGTL